MSKEVMDIPLKKRRLDSIACLIQGDDTCGASCFNGEDLILATNSDKRSNLVEKIVSYLSYVAQKSYEGMEKGAQYKPGDFKEKLSDNMRKMLEFFHQNSELYRANTGYQNAVKRALKKITRSLAYAYLKKSDEAALDINLAEAIRNKRIEFIGKNRVHAELKLINYLYETNQLNTTLYLGISKKCCKNCGCAIDAVNDYLIDKKASLSASYPQIEIRAEHGHRFNADIPEFLKTNEVIQKSFLRNVNRSTLEDAFYNNGLTCYKKRLEHSCSDSPTRSSDSEENFSDYYSTRCITGNPYLFHGNYSRKKPIEDSSRDHTLSPTIKHR